MLIHDMTWRESADLLARSSLARLACAYEGQPYIVPIHYAYDAEYIYSFTSLGKKITWMRANPLVCVEVDELAGLQEWATVICSGKYEELPNTPQYEAQRKHAYALLQRRPVWWEPGYAKTVLNETARPMEPIYFRIQIDRISGRRAARDTVLGGTASATGERPPGLLDKIFGRSPHRKDGH